jgi:hypothetical protein
MVENSKLRMLIALSLVALWGFGLGLTSARQRPLSESATDAPVTARRTTSAAALGG